MVDAAIVRVAERLKILDPDVVLSATQAVSAARRGSTEWSQHDLNIAESCLGAYLDALRLKLEAHYSSRRSLTETDGGTNGQKQTQLAAPKHSEGGSQSTAEDQTENVAGRTAD